MLLRALALVRLTGIISLSLLLNIILMAIPARRATRARLSSGFFELILKLCGIRLVCRIPRTELLSEGRFVIVANHISYLDILVISALRPCIFLAKKEVAGWPVFGWVARALGCVFVNRDSLMGRANALRACLRVSSSSDVALFPEGTTTAARLPELTVWAKGHAWIAQRAGADAILCLGLLYEDQDRRAWTDDMSLLPHLFQTLSLRTLTITVTGAWVPVQPSAAPAELAKTTHQQLCMAVNYECS